MSSTPRLELTSEQDQAWRARGAWTVRHAGELDEFLDELHIEAERIDARDIERLDSAGAQLLSRFARRIGLDQAAIVLKDE
ncbi:MAG: STAS domain-containing protein, partial [Pseudomonadota bacterium]